MAAGTEAAPRLLLLRHGQTAWNLAGRAQGHADVPLDEVGQAQAARVAPAVARFAPARLWSSDLARARQTADHVARACGLEVVEDARLREFSVGARQGLTWSESVERFPQIADGHSLGDRLRDVPGAESDEDVAGRIVPALQEMLGSLGPGEVGVAVTHGAAVKVGLAGLLGWPATWSASLGVLGNCRWALVEASRDPERTRLLVYGGGDFASMGGIG